MELKKLLLKSAISYLSSSGIPEEAFLGLTFSGFSKRENNLVLTIVCDETIASIDQPALLSCWKNCAKNNSKTGSFESQGMEHPEKKVLHYHCLGFMNAPFWGVITDRPLHLSAELQTGLSHMFLPFLFEELNSALKQEIVRSSISSVQEYLSSFSKVLSHHLLPWKSNFGHISLDGMEPGKTIEFLIEPDTSLTFTFPQFQAPLQSIHHYQFNVIKQFLLEKFNNCYTSWQLQQKNQKKNVFELLEEKLDRHESTAKELIALKKEVKKELEKSRSAKLFESDNAFYKGATAWVIRFNGQAVQLKKDRYKGLIFIHKLLSNPNQDFSPRILENEMPVQDKDSAAFTVFEAFQSVHIAIRQYNGIINDQEELKNALKRQIRNRPGNLNPTEDAELEYLIYHLAEELFLVQSIINISFQKEFIALQKEIKKHYDDACFIFRRKNPSPFLQERIIKQSNVIKRTMEWDVEARRLKQRVSRAIANSIEVMDNEDLKTYLAKTITKGSICRFTPLPESPIDWQLTID